MKDKIIKLLEDAKSSLSEADVKTVWFDMDGSGWNQTVTITVETNNEVWEELPTYKLDENHNAVLAVKVRYLRLAPDAEKAVSDALSSMVAELEKDYLVFRFVSTYQLRRNVSEIVYPVSAIIEDKQKKIDKLEYRKIEIMKSIEHLKSILK